MHTFSFHLFPGRCVLCGDNSGRERDLCRGCERALPRIHIACKLCALPMPTPGICGECQQTPPEFARARVPFFYQPPVDTLVQRLKYSGDLASGRVLAQLLLDYLPTRELPSQPWVPPTVLIPVPLHSRRLLSRGFNQTLELARVIARELGIPCETGAVRRTINTAPQQNLSRRARRRNMRNAFSVSGNFNGQRIAIIDDVITTGSTANTLARACLSAGAREVEVWAIARTAGKFR